MTYPPALPKRDIGPRGAQLGVSDAAPGIGGINPYLPGTGWDVIFQPADLSIPPDGEVEIYHIAIDGPIGSSAIVMRDGKIWDYVAQGWANGWDPSQPMLIRGGHYVQICWNVAFTSPPYNRTSNIRPQATLWLRLPSHALL